MPSKNTPIPDELVHLRQRLEDWRREHRPRTRLPEEMWQAAVELAKRHGLHRTAQSLPIDYGSLKKRIATGKPALPKFLEFLAPTSMAGCTVELESPHGKLRVEMNSAPDWTQLLRAWRQA